MMASLGRDVAVLGGRNIRQWTRNPASIASAVVFPLLFFGLFNLLMRRVMTARGFDYAQLLPSTVVVQAMFFVGMSAAYYVAGDRLTGMLARLRSLPISAASPILAHSVSDVSRAVVSVAVLTAVGVAAGMRFRGGVGGVIGFLVVPLVFAAVVALVMGLIGLVASSPEAAVSLASIPYLPLVMLSSGFAPVSDFPGWLQPFVRNQPTTLTIDLLRSFVNGTTTAGILVVWAAWMAGIAVVVSAAAAAAFRRLV